MANWDDVARLASELPEVTEKPSYGGTRSWRVKDKLFVWERPLRQKDRDELGDSAPQGDVVGFAVVDEGLKFALIEENPAVYFTTSHFDGYPALLARLCAMSLDELQEQIGEAWLAKAPKRVAAEFLNRRVRLNPRHVDDVGDVEASDLF